ncbi:AraC family transcriptional regulator [Paraburkholderia sp. GAS448]|uniref:AraC family transcriptional regulator n=1 Tax=Paraburkholderia sp. GAS448 TaxID=3035136 RepID=UPI003D215B11
MNPVGKALWFIESHFARDITLDDIASGSCVSRFHLSRAFEAATGRSVMRYVRGRRLSEAARSLADGAPDILAVAVEAVYGSHEAFTRAFRDQFGITPEAVRAQGSVCNIELVEPIIMDQSFLEDLAPPRIEDGKALLIAGLCERYTCEQSAGIAAQWQRFGPHFGKVPGQVGQIAYGVCFNQDDAGNFDYLCGVEVTDFSALPADFARVRIGEQRYAVFAHREHISTIRQTWNTIWNKWLPESEHEVADAPVFERYGEQFNPMTGMGGFELWIPLKV